MGQSVNSTFEWKTAFSTSGESGTIVMTRSLSSAACWHDVHIWAMSTTETALTVHLVRPGAGIDDGFLAKASKELHERFAIAPATFQVENGDTCHLVPAGRGVCLGDS